MYKTKVLKVHGPLNGAKNTCLTCENDGNEEYGDGRHWFQECLKYRARRILFVKMMVFHLLFYCLSPYILRSAEIVISLDYCLF